MSKLEEKIEHFSGNRRLNESSLEEPDSDDERTRIRWLKREGRKLPIARRLKLWRIHIIPPTKDAVVFTATKKPNLSQRETGLQHSLQESLTKGLLLA